MSTDRKGLRGSTLRSFFGQYFPHIPSGEALGYMMLALALIGIFTSATFEWIFRLTDQSSGWASVFMIVSGACLLGLVFWIDRKTQIPSSQTSLNKTKPAKHRVLIILVSNSEPAIKAIEYHKELLQHCWLVTTSLKADQAKEVREYFEKPAFTIYDPKIVNDVYDPLDSYQQVTRILGSLPAGLAMSDVICDYTGMTSHMSLGMALACINHGCHMQYVPEIRDEEGRGMHHSHDEPMEVRIGEMAGGTRY